MREIKDLAEMSAYSIKARARGKTIGLVPTMGCLHEGHLSLVEAAKKKADCVVVSIFVNPAQFSPGEDLNSYPRNLSRDKKLLKNFDVDILFIPQAETLYPYGYNTYVEVEELSKKLCGRSRPTHFRGVTTIIAKLLNLILPDYLFMGEKDFQQQLIIKKMVRELNFPVEVLSCPTVREYAGLAISSRNRYLSPKERRAASILYKALNFAREEIKKGNRDPKKLLLHIRSFIGAEPSIRLDYVAITHPETLEDAAAIKGKTLIALAAHVGKARLIDNLLVEE